MERFYNRLVEGPWEPGELKAGEKIDLLVEDPEGSDWITFEIENVGRIPETPGSYRLTGNVVQHPNTTNIVAAWCPKAQGGFISWEIVGGEETGPDFEVHSMVTA